MENGVLFSIGGRCPGPRRHGQTQLTILKEVVEIYIQSSDWKRVTIVIAIHITITNTITIINIYY